MTAHLCKGIVPGCYRCELNVDEVTAMHAEDYFEANIEQSYRASGVPEHQINSYRVRYISDCVMNPEAARELRGWAGAQ